MTARGRELLRYAINGVIATAAHYSVLFASFQILNFRSAGLANLMASTVGIALSFMGNRYFVFCSQEGPFLFQATRFTGLYAVIAMIHGAVLYFWTDRLGLNYNIGFIIAVVIQVVMGYVVGKRHVFNRRNIEASGNRITVKNGQV